MTNHPGIYQTGRVHDDGTTVTIAGWGLNLCAAACRCHRHPITGQLTIVEDHTNGTLGLLQHHQCPCCQPWTAAELAGIVRDLAYLGALETA